MALVALAFLLPTAASAQRLEAVLSGGPYYGLSGPAVRLPVGPVTGGDGVDIAIGDWSGDGLPDLLAGSAYGDLTLFIRGADGLLGPPQPITSSPLDLLGWPPTRRQASPELADWDGDGTPDLFLGLGEALYLYRRPAGVLAGGETVTCADNIALTAHLPGDYGHLAPCACDWDGDGDLDLLLADDVGRLWFADNTGSPTHPALAAPVQVPLDPALGPGGPLRVTMGDVAGDAWPDLLIGRQSGDVLVCERTDAGLAPPRLLLQAPPGACPRLGPWEGATKTLLVGLGSGLVERFEFSAAGPVDAGPVRGHDQPLDVGVSAVPVSVDWDGDGDRDLLVGGDDGRVLFFESRPEGFAEGKEIADDQGAPIRVAGDAWPCAVDLNGDRKLDLLVGSDDGTIQLWRGSGRGLTAAGPLLVSKGPLRLEGPTSVSASDYDGDGDIDLFIASRPAPGKPMPLSAYRCLYLENEAPTAMLGPIYLKAVPLDLLKQEAGARPEDGTELGLAGLELLRASAKQTEFLATTAAGVLRVLSARPRRDYPVLVTETTAGLTSPVIPPVNSATVATLNGKSGILCGLQPFGMVCFYPGVAP